MDTTRDDDFEFDFFDDEPATSETQSQRVRLPRRGQRAPRRPAGPPRGTAPLLRLVLAILGAIALIVIFAEIISSCAATSKHDRYAKYVEKVDTIASQSSSDGRSLADALTTPGLKVSDLEEKLRGISNRERQLVEAAQDVDTPGRLRDENTHLVEALQLRVSGVDGLAKTFQQTAATKSSDDASLLAEQADRLLASDVVWDDLYKDLVTRQLKADGVNGVSPPESHYVTNRELISETSMARVLERLRGASKGGTPTGLHGTNIVEVKAVPGDGKPAQTLDAQSENTVTATTSLAFDVTIQDSGDSQEVQIKVTLTIDKSGGPIVRTKTIDLINPGDEKTVTFTDLGQVPFATKTNVKVDVEPVPGETKTSNNSASYPVIFSLG
jgi:hypothetical protein